MVKRRRYSSKRRVSKRRRRVTRRRVNIRTRALAGLPTSRLIKFRYVSNGILDAPIGTTATHVYRINSIHDPDFTGIGHQPLGHDEWSAFYEKYCVQGAKITCSFWSTSVTGDLAIANVGLATRDTSTVENNIDTLIENGRCKYRTLHNSDGANNVKTIVYKWSRKKWFKTGPYLVYPQMASFGDNPTELAFLHIFVGPVISTQNLGGIYFKIQIDFIVKLLEPQTLARS